MGGNGSSSRRKSSKKKRKRDRASSQKKRSQRKKESRKRSRRCDSASSSYSDDDPLNLEHTSSFISKADHRRRVNKNLSTSSDDQSMSSDSDSLSAYDRRHKHRKASLKSTKKGRKRKRFASTSSNSDTGNVRKSKRSGRDAKTRKKSKKKSRLYLSSSASYDSESCSTCQSRSSSDGKHLKSEAIIDKEKQRIRGRESYKAHKRHRVRSPSYSSHSRSSNHTVDVGQGGGEFPPVYNPIRLRSVIAIADHSSNEEKNRWEADSHKEEIVYDKEDYPSPRSLDSNEGATKIESDKDSPDPSSNRACVEDLAGEKASELLYSSDPQPQRPHRNNVEGKDIDMSFPAAASGGDNLESILRQKALENLRKFRGELPSICLKKENNGTDVNVMATQEADGDHNKLAEQGSSDAQVTNQGGSSSKRDPAHLVEVQKFPEGKHNEKEYEITEQNTMHPRDGAAHLGCSKEDKGASSQTVLVARGDTDSGAVATNACSSSTMHPTESVGMFTGDNSLDRQNETTDGSQFEQRTMSVMRGGEMVQVSYKVYIPKRTPALARRQLRR